MMNKASFAVFLLSSACILYACSSSRTVFTVPQKMTGVVMVVGNEPFAKLAVRTADDKVYLVDCPKEIAQTLLSHQGELADLFYDEIAKKNSVDEIKVVKVIIHSTKVR